MFRQPNIPNLRFTIIQAVNPYIQSSSNKFIGKAVSFLPNKKTKVVLNLPKKLLGKNLKLTNQPSTDVVELSSGMRTASVAAKPKKDGKGSCSKLIKNVLNKYFDNVMYSEQNITMNNFDFSNVVNGSNMEMVSTF